MSALPPGVVAFPPAPRENTHTQALGTRLGRPLSVITVNKTPCVFSRVWSCGKIRVYFTPKNVIAVFWLVQYDYLFQG